MSPALQPPNLFDLVLESRHIIISAQPLFYQFLVLGHWFWSSIKLCEYPLGILLNIVLLLNEDYVFVVVKLCFRSRADDKNC